MRRTLSASALIFVLLIAPIGNSSGAASAQADGSIPKDLKSLILSTLQSTNLRVRDVNQSTVESWDYQSPNRAESIPRRFSVARLDYGFEIEVGDHVVDHFPIGQLAPPVGFKVVGTRQFVGFLLSRASGRWSNVQRYLFAPLIDALYASRYVRSKNTYVFTRRGGVSGRVTVNGRRVVSAQVTYLEAFCGGKSIRYHESESFYGIEHFAMVVLPPRSTIDYAKAGKLTSATPIQC